MADDSALNLRVESKGGEATVFVSGDVDMNSSPTLREELQRLLKSKPARLIIDLTNVGYMDSSGIGTIVELKRLIERYSGRLTLCGLQARVRGLFEITNLEKFFEIATTCDEARQK